MEQSDSREKVGQKVMDPEIVSKIKSGKVVTLTINEKWLPLYLDAASASGFEVQVIAKREGEEFPRRMEIGPLEGRWGVAGVKLIGLHNLAVSVEGPEGSKDFGPFWENLRSLQQKEA